MASWRPAAIDAGGRWRYVSRTRQMSAARSRGIPHEEHRMAPATPDSGGSIAEALDRRRRTGRPVRIGLIGAGQMGTDILVQTAHMPGIEVVAAADAVPEIVFTACSVAGNGPRQPTTVDGAAGVADAIARGRLAVARSFRDVCTAEG